MFVNVFVECEDEKWLEEYVKVCDKDLFDPTYTDTILAMFNVKEGTFKKIDEEHSDKFKRNLTLYQEVSKSTNQKDQKKISYPREGQHRMLSALLHYCGSKFTREQPKIVPNSLTLEFFTEESKMHLMDAYQDQQHIFLQAVKDKINPLEILKEILKNKNPEEILHRPLRAKIAHTYDLPKIRGVLGGSYKSADLQSLILDDSKLCRETKTRCSDQTRLELYLNIIAIANDMMSPLAETLSIKEGQLPDYMHWPKGIKWKTDDEDDYKLTFPKNKILKEESYNEYTRDSSPIGMENARRFIFSVSPGLYDRADTHDPRHSIEGKHEGQSVKVPKTTSAPYVNALPTFYINATTKAKDVRKSGTLEGNTYFFLPPLLGAAHGRDKKPVVQACEYIIQHRLIPGDSFHPTLLQPQANYCGISPDGVGLYIFGPKSCHAVSSAVFLTHMANAVLCFDPNLTRLRKALENVRDTSGQFSDDEMMKFFGMFYMLFLSYCSFTPDI